MINFHIKEPSYETWRGARIRYYLPQIIEIYHILLIK